MIAAIVLRWYLLEVQNARWNILSYIIEYTLIKMLVLVSFYK